MCIKGGKADFRTSVLLESLHPIVWAQKVPPGVGHHAEEVVVA